MGKFRGQEPFTVAEKKSFAVAEKKSFAVAEKKLDARQKLDVSKLQILPQDYIRTPDERSKG